MTHTVKFILTAALALGLIGAVAAYAKHRFSHSEHFAEHMIERVSDKLDLNTDQKQSLQILASEMAKVKTAMKRDLSSDRQILRDMLAAPSFDQQKALAMLNAKASALQSNAPGLIAAFGTFSDGLTAEQKTRLVAQIDGHKGHHRGEHWFEHHDDQHDD